MGLNRPAQCVSPELNRPLRIFENGKCSFRVKKTHSVTLFGPVPSLKIPTTYQALKSFILDSCHLNIRPGTVGELRHIERQHEH